MPQGQRNKSSPSLLIKIRPLFYQLHTLWLFSRSDLKTVVIPQTLFGCVALFRSNAPRVDDIFIQRRGLFRLPLIALWVWINLLGQVIANQRLSGSIIEDSFNKPWRPLPSKRLTPDEARRILLWILPSSYLVSILSGGTDASVALMVFTYMYNDLGGANENWILRNLLNAFGLSAFSLGVSEVAQGPGVSLSFTVYAWIAILATVIFSTIQLQDLPDIEGDRARGRRTMLVYGDTCVRWSISIPIMFWSFYCPFFWNLGILCYVPSLLLGSVISVRTLTRRSAKADAVTWKLWCAWMGSLYLLPLFDNTLPWAH